MTDRIERWLALKAQELQVRRGLEELSDVPEQLLVDRSHDARAREHGLELTRPRADLYLYARDPALAAAQEQLEHWRTRVQELQRGFREACAEGLRQADLDYEPRCRLTVQLRSRIEVPAA